MESVVRALLDALGEKVVRTGDAIPERNCNDWAGLPPIRPAALLLPRNTAEVATALRICESFRRPVVPQGGLTGLAGAARPIAGSVALSLERFSGVEEIDAASATMTVRAGTILESAQDAAAEAGFLLPLDLGARGSCQIGGNLATNAGGNRVIRFGMAREMVLGMEVVLADGTILSNLNRLLKNNAGYDLKQIFIGSEGTLGIICRAVLRLHARPTTRQVAFCALPDYPSAVALLEAARSRLAGQLSAFEVMWSDYYELMSREASHLHLPFPAGHAVYVLLESQGHDAGSDAHRFETLLADMLDEKRLLDAVLARSERDVRALWAVRDAVAEFPRILGRHVNFDLGLPIPRMDAYVRACRERLDERFPGIRRVFFGHVGDGNLHVVTNVPEGADAYAIEREVYELVGRFSGTVSAEHGIGTIKKPYLGLVRGAAEIETMRRLKRALDPRNILNPGRVIDS